MGEIPNGRQAAGTRWRLVTTRGTRRHVSSVVLNEEEAREHLDIEADMHEKSGWTVTRGEDVVVARKVTGNGLVERVLTIRESGPLDDDVN